MRFKSTGWRESARHYIHALFYHLLGNSLPNVKEKLALIGGPKASLVNHLMILEGGSHVILNLHMLWA
jgi:hypothetical protein